MKRVTYLRKGPIVVLKNSGDVTLAFGLMKFRDARWVLGGDYVSTRSSTQVVTILVSM